MNFLDAYLKEYVAIINHIIKNFDAYDKNELMIKDDVIYIKKDILFDMFEKSKYEKKPLKKLKTWASLNWIQKEKNRYTKKVYDPVEKKQNRMIAIDQNTFHMITELLNKELD